MNLYNKKPLIPLYIAILLVFLNTNTFAAPVSVQSEFNAYKNQQQQQLQTVNNQFIQYKEKLRKAFATYKKKTAEVWGKQNVMPDKTNWVDFQKTINQRSIVDFKQGKVNVEIAVPINTDRSNRQIKNNLKNNIQSLLNQPADTRSMSEIAQQPAIKSNWQSGRSKALPVLQNQVADAQGNEVKPADYGALAKKLANNARKKIVRGNDGKLRIVYEAQFKLVPDNIKIRAKRYQKTINENATQQQLKAGLIFAIIETESMFNPTARSPAPAFGLMQLVPTSGARDAYYYLYNKDKVVTDTYLYDPGNNIKLGSAYLHQLYYNYFKGIKSDQSRLWATIAAYNTGTGNVFKSFAGRYRRAQFGTRENWKRIALNAINRRSPEQVYTHMRNTLPYAETRHYIQTVRNRIPKYIDN